MKNVQDWMVNPTFLQDDIATYKRNQDPPLTPDAISTLKVLLNTVLEICSSDGDDDLDATQPESPY